MDFNIFSVVFQAKLWRKARKKLLLLYTSFRRISNIFCISWSLTISEIRTSVEICANFTIKKNCFNVKMQLRLCMWTYKIKKMLTIMQKFIWMQTLWNEKKNVNYIQTACKFTYMSLTFDSTFKSNSHILIKGV